MCACVNVQSVLDENVYVCVLSICKCVCVMHNGCHLWRFVLCDSTWRGLYLKSCHKYLPRWRVREEGRQEDGVRQRGWGKYVSVIQPRKKIESVCVRESDMNAGMCV